jgi:hypothetical protein
MSWFGLIVLVIAIIFNLYINPRKPNRYFELYVGLATITVASYLSFTLHPATRAAILLVVSLLIIGFLDVSFYLWPREPSK